MKRATSLLAFVIAVLANGAVAQTEQLWEGDTVRFETLQPSEGSHLRSVIEDENRTKRILQNALTGLLVGAGGGALVGPLLWSKDCYASTLNPERFPSCLESLTDGEARIRSTVVLGAAGSLVGGLVGMLLGPESRLETAPVSGARVSLAPSFYGGLTAGLTVVF